MTSTTTKPNLDALFQKLEEVSLRSGTAEGNVLYVEGLRLGKRQEQWAKMSQAVGIGVGIGVFFIMDLREGDNAVLLAAAVAFVSFGLVTFGGMILGKSMVSAQAAEWARRAERFVGDHGGV